MAKYKTGDIATLPEEVRTRAMCFVLDSGTRPNIIETRTREPELYSGFTLDNPAFGPIVNIAEIFDEIF